MKFGVGKRPDQILFHEILTAVGGGTRARRESVAVSQGRVSGDMAGAGEGQ